MSPDMRFTALPVEPVRSGAGPAAVVALVVAGLPAFAAEAPQTEAAESAPEVEIEGATVPDVAMLAEAAAPSPAPMKARPSATARYAVNLHSDPRPIELPDDATDDRLLYVSEKQIDGETWYRLRLGFFETEEEARSALDDWRADYPNAWPVRVATRERDAAGDRQP